MLLLVFKCKYIKSLLRLLQSTSPFSLATADLFCGDNILGKGTERPFDLGLNTLLLLVEIQ
jgi:hypothetical protein